MWEIGIAYNGAYPNLCRGTLIVTIDGTRWTFPSSCLSSGGQAWTTDDYSDASQGSWSISDWPENFPEDKYLRAAVVSEVNANVRHGCCGGCQ